ncbi:PIR protein [Plasmodium vivax]|uniref:VIR protein n=1 Tax=Plasmodium vivax TaxID=5855 RepID=A0A1G4E6K6_PLAVI|nr:PIR protein [Plasmodium vivax]SCA59798.1 VIR protein [Plasmodium vivax]
MGNPCEGNTKDYLNYPCYNTLKVYFDKIDIGYYGQQYLDDTLKALEKEGIKKYPYYNLFHEIARLYGGDDAFSQKGVIPSCIYSNYWLNKYIQEKHSSLYNETTFEMLKKFDYNYSQIRFNNQKNSCKSYMRLLNTDEYHRMDILYLLYSYYDQLGSSNLQNKPNERCTYVSLLAQHYRDISSSHEKYKDIFNQLELLKDLIEKRELHYNLRCSSTFKMITLPKEDVPNSEGPHGQKDTRESLPVASATGPNDVSGKSADRMTNTDPVILHQPPNTEATELNSSRNPVTEVTTENHHLVTAQEAAHYVGRTPEEEVHGETQHVPYPSLPEARFRAQRVQEPYNTLNMFSYQGPQQVDIHTPPEKSMSPTSQSEDVGVMTNIQNAFSSIVQNVEPAPVLGVSGGMGVLFLLFKYTPFGSFFGGRRRRMHQIPSSFRGFPPGEFPNFHEYDGGFIGYAPMNINPLAE